jgi:hypothetical protein
MPYVLDKGPYFSVIESLLSNPAKRVDLLNKLRAGAPGGVTPGLMLADLCGFDSPSLAGGPLSVAQMKAHLNEQWFGMKQVGGVWQKQPGALQTGWWVGYTGDPEAIMREAMIRAIEVSLGIQHPLPGVAAEVPQISPIENWNEAESVMASSPPLAKHWPIDVNWICQGPAFQCQILFQRTDAASPTGGKVTLLITTPPADGYPLTSQITRPLPPAVGAYTSADYADSRPAPNPTPLDPGAHNMQFGVWVVGEEDYERTRTSSTAGSTGGSLPLPTVRWFPKKPNIVTVRPAEWEGGVRNIGRRYA